MAYLEELLPEFRKGVKIRIKDWDEGEYVCIKDSEVMIFGDQGNDMSMFEVADFNKVAMGNAIDAIKDKADFVTKSNDEAGIAYAINKLIFEKAEKR